MSNQIPGRGPGDEDDEDDDGIDPETGEDTTDPQGPSDDFPTENMDEEDTPFGTGD